MASVTHLAPAPSSAFHVVVRPSQPLPAAPSQEVVTLTEVPSSQTPPSGVSAISVLPDTLAPVPATPLSQSHSLRYRACKETFFPPKRIYALAYIALAGIIAGTIMWAKTHNIGPSCLGGLGAMAVVILIYPTKKSSPRISRETSGT